MSWISILHESKREYYIKYININSEYAFYITNLVHLWENHFSETELLDAIQYSNPALEGDSTQLIHQCMETLFCCIVQNNAESVITLEDETKDLLLKVETLLGKFPFRIKLEFKLSTPLKFYEEVTSSLIVMIKELKESESHLIECLIKKDAEIQDYKAEGACLSLKHLETKVFNQQEHQQTYNPSNNCYFSYNDLASISNSNFIQASTPKHPIIHKNDAVSSVKKEVKETLQVNSSTSSPVIQTGIAPIIIESEEKEEKQDLEENISRLGKRKKIIRKQLNL